METGLRQSLSVGKENFEFELCRKENTPLGPVDVDQWWMDVTPLYAQRQCRKLQSRNHLQVIKYYWAICRQDNATRERDAQEQFLLAALLPGMRSQGSRRVFDDAFLKAGKKAEQAREVLILDDLLQNNRGKSLSREDFHHQSLVLLRSSEGTAGFRPMYHKLSEELLNEACRCLSRGSDTGDAVAIVQVQWSALMQRFGRRSRCDEEKLVLDVLSYEARAAFHHCYSVVWCGLRLKLAKDYGLSEQSLIFLSLWQTSPVSQERSSAEHCWSLFHGHVFGLHPGAARFLLTATGRELLGGWLQDVENDVTYGRLLNGLYHSIYDYSERRSQSAADRGPQARSNSPYEVRLDQESISEFNRIQRASKSD